MANQPGFHHVVVCSCFRHTITVITLPPPPPRFPLPFLCPSACRRYKSKKELAADLRLMFRNCREYNTDQALLILSDCADLERRATAALRDVPDTKLETTDPNEYRARHRNPEVFPPPTPHTHTFLPHNWGKLAVVARSLPFPL